MLILPEVLSNEWKNLELCWWAIIELNAMTNWTRTRDNNFLECLYRNALIFINIVAKFHGDRMISISFNPFYIQINQQNLCVGCHIKQNGEHFVRPTGFFFYSWINHLCEWCGMNKNLDLFLFWFKNKHMLTFSWKVLSLLYFFLWDPFSGLY